MVSFYVGVFVVANKGSDIHYEEWAAFLDRQTNQVCDEGRRKGKRQSVTNLKQVQRYITMRINQLEGKKVTAN